jgi:hypothetical protein
MKDKDLKVNDSNIPLKAIKMNNAITTTTTTTTKIVGNNDDNVDAADTDKNY